MKLHKITYHDPEIGICHNYAGSNKDAERRKREILDAERESAEETGVEDIIGSANPTIRVINVPTDKKGLLRWLNDNAVAQDGMGDRRY